MRKHNILMATTAILSLVLCESARAADTGSCGTNCIYTYENGTLTYSVANPDDQTPASITKSNTRFDLSGQIENIVIKEGIKKTEWKDGWYCTFDLSSSTNGKLTLPRSLTDIGTHTFCNANFSTIEINSDNAVFARGSFRFNKNATSTIIISEDSGDVFDSDVLYGPYQGVYYPPAGVNIACKGDPEVCKTKLRNITSRTSADNINPGYYVGNDEKGNIIEEWGPNGKTTYSYTYGKAGNVLSANAYDSEGNVTGSYTYDAGGNLVSAYQNGKAVYLRKRYTIPEADAATQGKGPFRLDITW